MKNLAEILKNVIFVTFISLAFIDAIVLIGEVSDDMSLTHFFCIKAAALVATFCLYRIGLVMTNLKMLPAWFAEMLDEFKKETA